jgi:hypothetical protein
MTKSATTVTFDQAYFDRIMKSAGVVALTKKTAEAAAAIARHNAPVATGDYKAGIAVEQRRAAYRAVFRVVGRDRKTLLVESKTGNLARSLQRIKGL